MNDSTPAISIADLHRSYGKTTTIKCLLNLLKPAKGEVQIFGMDPARDEVPRKVELTARIRSVETIRTRSHPQGHRPLQG